MANKYPKVRGEYIVTIGASGHFTTIPLFISGMACDIRAGTTQVFTIRNYVGTFTPGQVVEGQTSLTRGTIKHVTAGQMLVTGITAGKGVFCPGETLKVYQGGAEPACTIRDAGRLAIIKGVYTDTNPLTGDMEIAAAGWTVGAAGSEPPAEVRIVPQDGCQSGPTYAGKRLDGTLTVKLPYCRIEGMAIGAATGGIIVDTAAAGGGWVLIGSCAILATGDEVGFINGILVKSGSIAHIWGTGAAGWSGSGIKVENGATGFVRHCTLVRNEQYGIANLGACHARGNNCYQNVQGQVLDLTTDQNNVKIAVGDPTNYGFDLTGAVPRNWNLGYSSVIHNITDDTKKVYMKAVQIEEETDSAGVYHARDIRWRAKPMAAPNRATAGPADIGADDLWAALSYDNVNHNIDEFGNEYGDLSVSAYGNERKFRLPSDHDFPRTGISIRTSDTHVSLGGHRITHGQRSCGAQLDTGRTRPRWRFHWARPSYWDTGEAELFVACPSNKRIYCVDTNEPPAGQRIKWEIGQESSHVGLRNPWGVAGDATYLYIADWTMRAVYRVYRTGASRGQLTPTNHTWSGSGSGGTIKPVGVYLYGGYLFVADHQNSKIHVLSAATMSYVASYGSYARTGGVDTFAHPISLSGRGDRLYVTDWGARDTYGNEGGSRIAVLSISGSTLTWVTATVRVAGGQWLAAWGNGTNIFAVNWRPVGGSAYTQLRKYLESDGSVVATYNVAAFDGNVAGSHGTGLIGEGTTLWIGQYCVDYQWHRRETLTKLDVSSACTTSLDIGMRGPTGAGVIAVGPGSTSEDYISDIPISAFGTSQPIDISICDGTIDLHADAPGNQLKIVAMGRCAIHDLDGDAQADYDMGAYLPDKDTRVERIHFTNTSYSFFPDEGKRQHHEGQLMHSPYNIGTIRWRDIWLDCGPFSSAKFDYQGTPPDALLANMKRVFIVTHAETIERRPTEGDTERTYGYTQVNPLSLYFDALGIFHDWEIAGSSGGGVRWLGIVNGANITEIRRIRNVYTGRTGIYWWQVHGSAIYDSIAKVNMADWYMCAFQRADQDKNWGADAMRIGPVSTGGAVTVDNGISETYIEQAAGIGQPLIVMRGNQSTVIKNTTFRGNKSLIRIGEGPGSAAVQVEDCIFDQTEAGSSTIRAIIYAASDQFFADFHRCAWQNQATPMSYMGGTSGVVKLRHYQVIHVTVKDGAALVDGATVTFTSGTSDPDFAAFPSGLTNVNGLYEPTVHTQLAKKTHGVAITLLNRDTITVHAEKLTQSGSAQVPVTALGGVINVEVNFQTAPAPIVDSITPTSGPTVGGQTGVVIGGNYFDATCTVTLGGTAATVTGWTATTITITTPAHAVGLVDVVVTKPGIGADTLTNGYEYVSAGGGEFEDLFTSSPLGAQWSKVLADAGDMGTYLAGGGGDADGAWQSTPAYPGASDRAIVRYVGAAVSDDQEVNVYVDRLSNGRLRADALVRTAGATWAVDFRGYAACLVILGAGGAGDLKAYRINTDGTMTFLGNFFSLTDIPLTGSIRIRLAVAGTTLTGEVYYPPTGTPAGSATKVDATFVNGTPAWGFVFGSAMTSANEDFDRVKVIGTAVPSSPVITNIAPAVGDDAGGTSVTITGTGFRAAQGAGTVHFGTDLAAAYTSWNDIQIVCTTPAHAAGFVDVKVTNDDTLYDTEINGFEFLLAPTVLGIDPASGPPAGGTAVSITGTGFRAGATVLFGLTAADAIIVANPTTITCTTPAHAAGIVSVTVTNTIDGQSGVLDNAFSYSEDPIASEIMRLVDQVTLTKTSSMPGASTAELLREAQNRLLSCSAVRMSGLGMVTIAALSAAKGVPTETDRLYAIRALLAMMIAGRARL